MHLTVKIQKDSLFLYYPEVILLFEFHRFYRLDLVLLF